MARAQEVLPPSRLKAQRRKARTLKRIVFAVVFVLIVIGAIALTHLSAIRVREVDVVGTQAVAPDAIKAAVLEELSGSIWFIIPKNNVAVYSAPQLKAYLLTQFPKLKTVEISLDTFHSLKVEVTERLPSALWCGNVVSAQTDGAGECNFLDENGYVYESAPAYSGSAYVRWFGALDASDIPAHYLREDTFRSLQPLVASLQNGEQTPERVVVDENNDVFVHFAEGFELRFTLTQKPESVLASLSAALKSSALAGKKLSDLQYLDLRFGDRLYYKFK